LATSLPAKVVCADPTLLGERCREVAHALAPLLQTNENYLIERLTPRTREVDGKTNKIQYVILKRKVQFETWEKIEKTMAQLSFGLDESKLNKKEQAFYRALRGKAIFPEDDEIRIYPNQHLAAHIIGFVGNDELQTGVDGIERFFNSKLTGIRGWRRTELDNRRRELVAYRDENVEPRDGLNVVLTIDAGLQHIVETELADAMQKHSPISASCIVVRPRTGEILAMATLPNFDPNRPGATPVAALKNRVIADIAEPGSTFKIVVVSGALSEKVITLNDVFNCEHGHFSFAGKVLHDHESYGPLSVEQIITKSSNIGAAKIAIERLHEEKLYEYIRNFGFGERTGIPLPGEVRGIVHPLKKWTKISIGQIPMGQGISVTPLQMVMAMSAIANKGQLMQPMLVDRMEDDGGKVIAKYQPQSVRQVISEAAASQLIIALKTVVGTNGTAPKAHLDHYTAAGKTGTAQKNEQGHYVQKFFSSFIGFFPADNPELCISIVLDEPKNGHYGGQIAAPFFKTIAERAANYLNLKPDIEPELPIDQTMAATGSVPSHTPRLGKNF